MHLLRTQASVGTWRGCKGVCVNNREERSHGHWGYAKALGTCCDLEPTHRAVSARERERDISCWTHCQLKEAPLGNTHKHARTQRL